MLKNDLDVAMEGELHPLLFGQYECRSSFLAQVPPLRVVSEQEIRLKPVAVIHLEERKDSLA